jgi:subtilisin family serine protease
MAYEYKVLGKPVALDVDPSVVAVRFHGSPPHSMRAHATEAAGVGPFTRRFEIPGEKLTIIPVQPLGPAAPTSMSAIKALTDQPEVAQALPVFRIGGNQVVATDRVVIGLDDPARKSEVLQKHGLTLVSERDDKVVGQIPDGADVFAVVHSLDQEPAVRFAEPDFVTIGRHIPKRVAPVVQPLLNDPLVQEQYAMKITQAVDAWQLVRGSPNIRIAVLDEGVDTHHPDLANAIVGTFDADDSDSFQEPNPWDGHGTACAGLAAAIGTNGVGISGSGGGCSLMGVRIAFSQFSGGPWITTNTKIARAIAWSWQNGADVLSNSWGGGAPSNEIAEEFDKARRLGRNGRGCVVVIAAGNEFGPVTFPANLPNVVTVAATNEFDEPKTPTSKDGENWWGTCFGSEVDIGAPGVHNLTTDISGTAGYAPGDYEPKFNGTSSATPIVAGACGLVLSANPNLTEAQVRDILKNTADKVGPLPYVNGRNDFFGAGRLNVLKAVQAVMGPHVAHVASSVATTAPARSAKPAAMARSSRKRRSG